MNITKETKQKVEEYLKEYECATSVVWGEDYCTIFDVDGNAIEDFLIDIEDDTVYYTPVSYPSVTLRVE